MLNLTHQERQVVLFLITVALIGAGINFFVKINSRVSTIIDGFQDIGKADLNNAGKELLMGVSGIGVKLTQRIIEYRDKEGGFKKLEDLKNIKGITDYKYEKIKEYFIIK